jgi:molybdopterin molybdotransferase
VDLGYEHALELILASVPPAVAETVALDQAHRRILAETLLSTVDLPPFDNSGVDGYAVQASDLEGASAQSPVALRILGQVAAGETWEGAVGPGSCVRLFTGSPLPQGADAVAMQEDTRVHVADPDLVDFLAPVTVAEFVRRRGEDVSRSTVLARAGEALTPGRIALLAATGRAQVRVGRCPEVAILATGSELKEAGTTLQPGEIYESNRAGLAALVSTAGGVAHAPPLVPDDLEASRAALEAAFKNCDVVVTSGGVSVGELDFVRRAVADIGVGLEFWRVAIKPGRPFAFGKAGSKLFFGLPGNPVSALVTFFLLVRPALLRFQGAAEVSPRVWQCVLAEDLSNPGNRRHFVRVRVDRSGSVYSAGSQGSHVLSTAARANGLVDLQPGAILKAGSRASVLTWE